MEKGEKWERGSARRGRGYRLLLFGGRIDTGWLYDDCYWGGDEAFAMFMGADSLLLR